LGITFEEFAQLGKLDPENEGEAFNMAVFAMENANYLNGVAKLHAKVTRGMFHSRWPGYPESEVPIQAVTNGIHTTTWISQPIAELLDRAIGLEWRSQSSDSEIWNRVWQIDDRELWETKATLRKELVRFSRNRLKSNLMRRGATPLDLMEAETVLDPGILTIGFARRFATYKRAALMLSDKERLKAILYHPERPVQIVIAGKSHPKDDGGKKLIQELVTFMKDEGARSRMVFLEDYDMEVARRLVQGVDVWLNNPRRPHEASGTSGMKVVPNGGLNCSVLDGWWDEAYTEGIGWAIGDERQFPDEDQQDWIDSQALYHLIESEIGPKFYNRNHEGLPHEWIHMMKRSMAQHSPQFSTARMVSDYSRNFYVPAWNAFQALTTNGLSRAQAALDWRARIRSELPKAKFVSTHAETSGEPIVGAVINFQAEVALGSLSPNEVDVQLVYGPVESSRDIGSSQVLNMFLIESEAPPLRYETSVQLESAGEIGYAFRIVPKHEDIVIPAELNCVVWQNGG
jgi:starch phosphorylase